MYIDFQALKRDIPIENVLEHFGEAYSTKKQFRCVSKNHKDQNPSMGINHKNGSNTCHCFSCGVTFNPLSLVMDELECSAYEAGKYMIEHMDLDRSIYVLEEDDKTEEDPDPFPFSIEEMKDMGLSMNYTLTTTDGHEDELIQITIKAIEEQKDHNLSAELTRDNILDREKRHISSCAGNRRISMKKIYKEDKEGFYYVLNMHLTSKIRHFEQAKADLREIFDREKKTYARSAKADSRTKITEAFLKLKQDPEGADEKTCELLTTPEAQKVVAAYIPLYETHALMDEMDENITKLKTYMERIPEVYRMESLDDMLEEYGVQMEEERMEER